MLVQRRVTIGDIARHAGVSVGTASNVLNGKGRYSDATRDRVLASASHLNYAPNALVKSLQTGRTRTIGAFMWRVVSDRRDDLTIEILSGICMGVAERRYDTLIYSQHPPHGEVPPTLFLDGRVEGAIVAPGGPTVEGLSALSDANLPVVALYQDPVPSRMGVVNVDNVGGMMEAVAHLVALGHRRIGFVSPTYNFDFRERLRGWREALLCHGLMPDTALWVPLTRHNDPAELATALDKLAADSSPATAVVAGNDGCALGLLSAARVRGLRVPEQLSVIGFDDAQAAVDAGLTTVRQPAEQLGYLAADFLFRLLHGGQSEECRAVLPTDLVIRSTTGPARRPEPHTGGRRGRADSRTA